MRHSSTYLIFPGTCRAALNTYAAWFKGSIVTIQTFAESPVPVAEEDGPRIFNAEFKAQGIGFMASDDLPGSQVTQGSNFAFLVHFDDASEQARIYQHVLEGGTAIMPLPEDFEEARFAMASDRFGIQWMLNYQRTEQKPGPIN